MVLEDLFDFVILGLGETFREAVEDAESKLPAPVADSSFYVKLKMDVWYDFLNGHYEARIMYNTRKPYRSLN